MNRKQAAAAAEELTSVTFVPLPKTSTPAALPSVAFRATPMVSQVLSELRQPLTELARRIHRVGAVSGGTVAMLTGCRRSVGCTTLALALAAAAAEERSVLLVDGNFCSPGLASLMGLLPSRGWDEDALESGALEQAVQPMDSREPWGVLGLKSPVSAETARLCMAELGESLARFRQHYSLVLLDTGSVWDSGRAWAASVDVALVVCDSGRGEADEWAGAWDCLEEAGTHVMGIVETFT